ncbi:Ubiquinone biosynthesis protein UbiV [Azospirillaceae bacterium]
MTKQRFSVTNNDQPNIRNDNTSTALLTLGPVMFHWPPEQWRDFYFSIADQSEIDEVFLGEVVCSKRSAFYAEHLPTVIDRLSAAGKRVVLSSPALTTQERERKATAEMISASDFPIEINDFGCFDLLGGRTCAVGPFVNVYNEGTLTWLANRGARSVCLPCELPIADITALAIAASQNKVDLEIQVFGRLPLAISARCYHARIHGLHKDGCQFVCNQDPDGLLISTMDHHPFLAVNGVQTLSHAVYLLTKELFSLIKIGVRRFRLMPHTVNMIKISRYYRDFLNHRIDIQEAMHNILQCLSEFDTCNGYYHDRPGTIFYNTAAAET